MSFFVGVGNVLITRISYIRECILYILFSSFKISDYTDDNLSQLSTHSLTRRLRNVRDLGLPTHYRQPQLLVPEAIRSIWDDPIEEVPEVGRRQGIFWIATVPREKWSIPSALPDSLNWIKGQLERGESGYEHWQFVFALKSKASLPAVKKIFGIEEGHFELTRSEKAEGYCWKDDTSIGHRFELGAKPIRRNEKTDWDTVWDDAVLGQFLKIPASIRVAHYRSLCSISSHHIVAEPIRKKVYYLWGPTHTGKSHRAWSEAGMDAYRKNPRSKWWDGYQGQRNVVMDEFRGGIDISYLLGWFDWYPATVEVKGSTVALKCTNFWITSNLPLERLYDNDPKVDETTLDALRRRLEIIPMFDTFEFPE